MSELGSELKQEIGAVIKAAYRVDRDVGGQVEVILTGFSHEEVSPEETARTLRAVIKALRQGAKRRGDTETLAALTGEIDNLAQNILARSASRRKASGMKTLELMPFNGVEPGPVQPAPCYQGRVVHMNQGFVNTADINLWEGNDRLEIHLRQFEMRTGRKPSAEEILEIMLSRMDLPGVPNSTQQDQFEIVDLARSISQNGVRRPPIIDIDGTLLDGNRRLAASNLILESDEFTAEQKRRVDKLFVWQLTEHATEADRRAVVVALNFEPDCKQDWPEYVKARKVFEDWEEILALEPKAPSPRHAAQLKRELSIKYALGPETSVVNRYIKMVGWANEFEDHHRNKNQRDKYEVMHRANHVFQYFDELGKGGKPGGVAHTLNQDDAFKGLVFDLLFDGKFRNWQQVRQLKFIAPNNEARDCLLKARETSDRDEGKDHVDHAVDIARASRAEERELGANTRIESFVRWLEQLPVRAFRDKIRPENLGRLLRALQLVQTQAETILGDTGEA